MKSYVSNILPENVSILRFERVAQSETKMSIAIHCFQRGIWNDIHLTVDLHFAKSRGSASDDWKLIDQKWHKCSDIGQIIPMMSDTMTVSKHCAQH